jgi:hypothetical protein
MRPGTPTATSCRPSTDLDRLNANRTRWRRPGARRPRASHRHRYRLAPAAVLVSGRPSFGHRAFPLPRTTTTPPQAAPTTRRDGLPRWPADVPPGHDAATAAINSHRVPSERGHDDRSGEPLRPGLEREQAPARRRPDRGGGDHSMMLQPDDRRRPRMRRGRLVQDSGDPETDRRRRQWPSGRSPLAGDLRHRERERAIWSPASGAPTGAGRQMAGKGSRPF